MEGYVNLFINDHEGTNKPHYKGYFKIDGVDHEFALWPAKEGKKGFSGKYKPKTPKEESSNTTQADVDKAWEMAEKSVRKTEFHQPAPFEPDSDIPF